MEKRRNKDRLENAAKILDYETFLNDTLRTDLQNIHTRRDDVYRQSSEYLQLKTVIEKLKETKIDKGEMKTKVDLGCNFYVQAQIPDSSRIYVCVGYGFFVEFTLDEALNFIAKKTKRLTESSDTLTKDSAKVKAHIKIVLEGLRELQHISDKPYKQHRDVFF